jgi:NAD(P)-dependent dehydrogenase (short-subunit alcohol dehydrogenase family)
MTFRLDDETVLVTGSARGIGRATAIAFAEAGANIAVLDRPQMMTLGTEVVESITALGKAAKFYPFDVTDIAEIPSVVARVVADFGNLDVLVNNAGRGDTDVGLTCTPDEWDAIMTLNLKSMFFFCQAAAAHMAPHGNGRIVNLGSSHAFVATGSGVSYKASKGGVHSLTRELAVEWIKLGIRVNAVAPGPVESPLMRELDAKNGFSPEDIRTDISRRVPLGRRLRPEEVAAAIVFLATPAASAVVGHILSVDGGQTII